MKPEHFTLHEVAGGIWAAEGSLTGASVGNAAIIDVGGKTVVVDTFMTDVAAVELRATAERLTGNRVFLAVNSHWHGDHTNGNQVFGDVPIVSTAETMDMIVETTPRDLSAWQAELDLSIESLREAAEAGDEQARVGLEQQQHIRNLAGNFRLTLPNLLINGRLVIEGERRIEIETHGPGHTVSDTTVWIPSERTLVTGDLCWNGIHPRLRDGFPAAWGDYTAALIDLKPLHVVPGHGRPGTAEVLRDLPEYFRNIERMVDLVRNGTDPSEISPPSVSAEWGGITRFRNGLAALAARR